MNRTYKILVAVLLPIALVLGCSSNSNEAGPPVSFSVIGTGGNLGGAAVETKIFETYQDQTSFDNALANYSIAIDDVAIDFATEQVALVSMGQRTSGGYSIAAESVSDAGAYIELKLMLSSPGADCVVTGALTHPYQVLSINSQKEVRTNERTVTENCS
ncbi:MAG: protease complex subunit PrcB family protein [Granulosicoccus sp.]|nr:protease complex subunit PrcB family protein [Granulosicoccus sp.]